MNNPLLDRLLEWTEIGKFGDEYWTLKEQLATKLNESEEIQYNCKVTGNIREIISNYISNPF